MASLVLLRHGESDWNEKNLFTGWVDVDLSAAGEAEARRGGELLRRARPAARRRAHLAAASRDPHRADRARRRRPALDPGAPLLAAQRAALRRAAGQGQGRRTRRVRRGAVHALAPLVRRAAAAARRRTTSTARSATRATPTCSRPCRRTECLKDVVDRMLPYWYDAIVPDLRRPASCWSPRTATRCARWSSTWTACPTTPSSALNIPTGIPLRYDLDDTTCCRPDPARTSTRTPRQRRSRPSPTRARSSRSVSAARNRCRSGPAARR